MLAFWVHCSQNQTNVIEHRTKLDASAVEKSTTWLWQYLQNRIDAAWGRPRPLGSCQCFQVSNWSPAKRKMKPVSAVFSLLFSLKTSAHKKLPTFGCHPLRTSQGVCLVPCPLEIPEILLLFLWRGSAHSPRRGRCGPSATRLTFISQGQQQRKTKTQLCQGVQKLRSS